MAARSSRPRGISSARAASARTLLASGLVYRGEASGCVDVTTILCKQESLDRLDPKQKPNTARFGSSPLVILRLAKESFEVNTNLAI